MEPFREHCRARGIFRAVTISGSPDDDATRILAAV